MQQINEVEIQAIQLQQDMFMIHSARTPINLLNGAEHWSRKFIIRHENIAYFFFELRLLGTRKYRLFSDLSALTSALKFIYFQRESVHAMNKRATGT